MESLHSKMIAHKLLLGSISTIYAMLKVVLLTLLSFVAVPLSLCFVVMVMLWLGYMFLNDAKESYIHRIEVWAHVKTKDLYE